MKVNESDFIKCFFCTSEDAFVNMILLEVSWVSRESSGAPSVPRESSQDRPVYVSRVRLCAKPLPSGRGGPGGAAFHLSEVLRPHA